MSDHDDSDRTPPLGHIGDPVVERALHRIWTRIDHERRDLEAKIEHIRKRQHELAEHQSKMYVEMLGIDGKEGRMGHLEDVVAEIKADTSSARASSRAAFFWIVGEAIAVIVLMVGAFVTMKVALASLESDQEATDDKVDRIERSIDKMDGRLDEALRSRAATSTP